MANGHGGKRLPRKPAPVSGPGSMSKRTDGGPAKPQYVAGLPYGEGQDFMDLQTSAPMGGTPGTPQPTPGPPAAQGRSITPLDAPTALPDEPLTAGAPFGPGPGPDVLAGSQKPADVEIILKYLPALQAATGWENTPDTYKSFVRWLQGQR